MWFAIAWLTPVAIPISLFYTFTLEWIPKLTFVGIAILALAMWLLAAIVSSIQLGRHLAGTMNLRKDGVAETVLVMVGIFAMHSIVSALAIYISWIIITR